MCFKVAYFLWKVRVANESKGVICLAVTFRHSTVITVGLTSSEEMVGCRVVQTNRERMLCVQRIAWWHGKGKHKYYHGRNTHAQLPPLAL